MRFHFEESKGYFEKTWSMVNLWTGTRNQAELKVDAMAFTTAVRESQGSALLMAEIRPTSLEGVYPDPIFL